MYGEFFKKIVDIKNKLQKPDVPHAVGEIVDSHGEPVKNFKVSLLEEGKKAASTCMTDDVGCFQFPNLTWNRRYRLVLELAHGETVQRAFATTSDKQETNLGKIAVPSMTVQHVISSGTSTTSSLPTELLKDRDYYLLIDTSISMTANYPRHGHVSRFEFVREGTLAFVDTITELDNDGITLLTFDAAYNVFDHVYELDQVHAIFDVPPSGMNTLLAKPLLYVFKDYLQKKRDKQTQANGAYIIVVTDGEAQDGESVKKYIAEFSRKLDSQAEAGILFLVIGDDPKALAFIEALDKDLKHSYNAQFDIVAADQFTSLRSINDALLAALTPNS
ncbi:MAG: carboxypeptidase regulatory-like domain-containing protein [Thiotrichaceae bacterium]|nr:carboxypeptidase regulatory-like domain-containing protein [Thiotrichaceae bacterium]